MSDADNPDLWFNFADDLSLDKRAQVEAIIAELAGLVPMVTPWPRARELGLALLDALDEWDAAEAELDAAAKLLPEDDVPTD